MDGEIINVFDALGMLEHGDTEHGMPAVAERQADTNLKPSPTLNTRSCGLIAKEVAEWLEGQQFNPRWMACSKYIDQVRSGRPLPGCTAPATDENVPTAGATVHGYGHSQTPEEDAENKSQAESWRRRHDTLARLASLILLGSTVTINQPIDATAAAAAAAAAETLAPDQSPTKSLQPQLISALEMHSIARDAQKVGENRQTPGPSIAPLWPALLQREREEVWADQVTRQRIRKSRVSFSGTLRAPASLAGRESFMACIAPRPTTRRGDSFFQALAKDLSAGEDHRILTSASLEERRHRALEVFGIEVNSRSYERSLVATVSADKRSDTSSTWPAGWVQPTEINSAPASSGHYILPTAVRSFSLPLNHMHASEQVDSSEVGPSRKDEYQNEQSFTRLVSPKLACIDETPPPSINNDTTPDSTMSRVVEQSEHLPSKVLPKRQIEHVGTFNTDHAPTSTSATERTRDESISPATAHQRPLRIFNRAPVTTASSPTATPPIVRRLSQLHFGQFTRRWSLGRAKR